LRGADLQLIIEKPPIEGEQVSFFASEYEQIQMIDEAESAQKAPSAFSMPQDIIDDFLRSGGNMENHRMLVVSEFSKQKPISEIAAVLPRIFVGGHGLKLSAGDVSAWYYPDGIHLSYGRHIQHSRAAQIISWED